MGAPVFNFNFLFLPPIKNIQWAWWYVSVIPATRRQRQGNHSQRLALGKNVRCYLKKTTAKKG
jgi:hypothetical protein